MVYRSQFNAATVPALVAGDLHGIRTFSDRGNGVLHSPLHSSSFCAGENVAVCKAGGIGVTHQIAGKGCSCGFYAYTQEGFDQNSTVYGTVEAVVQGYGRATVGSLGFRAEKLKILAIVHPDAGLKDKPISQFKLHLARIGATPTLMCIAIVFIWLNLILKVFWNGEPGALWWTIEGVGWAFLVAHFYAGWTRYGNKRVRHRLQTYGSSLKQLQATYPDAQFFPTAAQALKAFPLTESMNAVLSEGAA